MRARHTTFVATQHSDLASAARVTISPPIPAKFKMAPGAAGS
jgi:hypothetical protein